MRIVRFELDITTTLKKIKNKKRNHTKGNKRTRTAENIRAAAQRGGGGAHSLDVVDVLSSSLPHVRHVGGVGHRLAPQKCILGLVECGACGRDDDDRWTWAGYKRRRMKFSHTK